MILASKQIEEDDRNLKIVEDKEKKLVRYWKRQVTILTRWTVPKQ